MSLTINIEPESEARLREEAASLGLSVEQLTAQRLVEAELLWRIRSSAPEPETQLLHRLLRRRKSHALSDEELAQLQSLLDDREERAAQRLRDLGRLSQLRRMPVRRLMEQLGIRPITPYRSNLCQGQGDRRKASPQPRWRSQCAPGIAVAGQGTPTVSGRMSRVTQEPAAALSVQPVSEARER